MKVRPFKILKPYQHNLVVEEYRSSIFYNQLHQHEEIQISYIVHGHGRLIVGDSVHSFLSGDIYVLGTNTPHLFQSTLSEQQSHMISIFFTKEGYGKIFNAIPELFEINRFFEFSAKGIRVRTTDTALHNLFSELLKASDLQRFICFLDLIKRLLEFKREELIGVIPLRAISNAHGRRLQLIFDYLMNHFDTEIQLKQIADIVHMTPHSFCRFFKQQTNKTFFQFLIELRIEHACQLLLDSKMLTIAAIAERSGFSSLSNFNRKFKKIKKLTPSKYAKKFSVQVGLSSF